jgi:hypothetical protein
MKLRGRVLSTLETVCDLARRVRHRIGKEFYGRRFGDPFKDLLRELHRYLEPDLARVPKNQQGQPLGTRKGEFEEQVRKQAALELLDSLGISPQEVARWAGEKN